MDSLNAISIFVQVANSRNFSEAGRLLGLTSSAIGKSVARMEARLMVRLFDRTTRSLKLTPEGSMFLDRCRRILEEVEAAEVELTNLSSAPAGKLRINLPNLPHLFMPALNEFMKVYPEVELELHFSDAPIDTFSLGMDAVITSDGESHPEMLSKTLATFDQVLVAAPEYIKERGWPADLTDLASHAVLRLAVISKELVYRFARSPWDAVAKSHVRQPMVSNNLQAILDSARAGLGIAGLPRPLVSESLSMGDLVIVLDGQFKSDLTFTLMWPVNRETSPTLLALIDHLRDRLAVRAD